MASRDVVDIREEITAHLRTFLSHNTAYLAEISPSLERVGVSLSEYILDSGKRLRPIFAYAGYLATGKEPDSPAMKAMASLELLQACALIHDDLMDKSDTRRGNPSLHRKFEKEHQQNHFAGSAINYGEASAILIGDLALVWSDQMLHQSGISTSELIPTLTIHDEMRVELMAGQFLDIHEQGQKDWDKDRALRIARYKSGKYTIERPLHFGATIAGGDSELMKSLSGFGLPLGEAFQLRDDLLGVFGDPDVTGKPAGDDLREGKRTLLIAFTHESLTEDEKKRFYLLFGKNDLSAEQIEELRSMIRKTSAEKRVEELIEHLTSQSLSALEADNISNVAASFMRSLVKIATKRSS